ncbi:MAG: carboxymuconolactone decarboxylase family protein [Planctomycetota bacterium]
MAWIELPSVESATGRLGRLFAAAIERAGRVWRITHVMAPNPKVLEASMALYRAIMFGESPLSRAQRELVAVVVAKTNGCHY